MCSSVYVMKYDDDISYATRGFMNQINAIQFVL